MVSALPVLPLLLASALLAGCGGAARAPQEDGAESPATPAPGRQVVTAEDIERSPGQPIEEVLMNRFPGVWVTRTADGRLAIRIRGRTSITGSNEPLYVIDGVAIRPGPGGSLSGINPYDIETIEILTDPAGTTMYGVRGANGVIVITTKTPG